MPTNETTVDKGLMQVEYALLSVPSVLQLLVCVTGLHLHGETLLQKAVSTHSPGQTSRRWWSVEAGAAGDGSCSISLCVVISL